MELATMGCFLCVSNVFWDAAAEVYERLEDFKNLPDAQVDIDSVLQKLIEPNEDI